MKFTISSTTMNLFAFFLTIFTLLGSFAVQAAPIVQLEQRDVYVPPILSPTSGTVWKVGQEVTVTWDVSNPPAQITNKIGRIMLRKGDRTTPVVLAGNFDILKGRYRFRVPQVVAGNDYAIVLFGDSGNFSPQFTIKSPYSF